MRELLALIQDLQGKLARFRKDGLKETPTRTIFVDPLLQALGWDVRDPDEVQLEYPTIDGKSVDYALKINQRPVLLVEAKGLNDPLADVKDITQTTGYAANDGIVWCILTNGVRWRVYRSIEQCPAPEKLLYEVSYDPVDLEGVGLEQVVEQFCRFSREKMATGTLDTLGEQTFTDGKVRKGFARLMADPPRTLLQLVRSAAGDESLKPKIIKESLARILSPLLTSTGVTSSPKQRGKKSEERHSALKSGATRRGKPASPHAEESHTQGKPREVLELYQRLDQFCLGLRPGTVQKRIRQMYIAYGDGKRTFCSVHLRRGGILIWLKLKFGRLVNAPSFARDVSAIGHWGVGDVEMAVSNAQQLAEAEPLIRQSFEGP